MRLFIVSRQEQMFLGPSRAIVLALNSYEAMCIFADHIKKLGYGEPELEAHEVSTEFAGIVDVVYPEY